MTVAHTGIRSWYYLGEGDCDYIASPSLIEAY